MLFFFLSTSFAFSFNVSVPKKVEIGKWFYVNVTVVPDGTEECSTYFYVFKGLNCVSQGWTANKITKKFNVSTTFYLQDLIKKGTEEGIYKLRVKVICSGISKNQTFYVRVVSEGGEVDIETYLYLSLVALSLLGLALFWRFGK